MEQNNMQNKEKPESSKTLTIILISLIIVLVIGSVVAFFVLKSLEENKIQKNNGETQNNQNIQENTTIIKCPDLDCMISASETCSEAEFLYTKKENNSGFLIDKKTKYLIKNDKYTGCVLNLTLEEYDLDYSASLTQEMLENENTTMQQISNEIEQANNRLDELEGSEGVCIFMNNSDLKDFFTKMKNNEFEGDVSCTKIGNQTNCTTMGDWNLCDCSGEYFNIDLNLGVERETV